MPAREQDYDHLWQIIRYEEEGLPEDETQELFQYLVDTGLAWKLQGFYGRQAARMIEADVITAPS